MTSQWDPEKFDKCLAGLHGKKIHLEKLRFPNYRNIQFGAELVFQFPITVLLGRNGTNKSSILQAIYGAGKGKSVGEFWFETALDAIPETNSDGLKQSVAHTYRNEHNHVVECLKARAPRGLEDPDYWESVKPSTVYGFPPGAGRVSPIAIPIVHLDFRQVLPAFDKYFYFPDARHLLHLDKYAKAHNTLRRNYRPQDYLRRRTPKVKRKMEAEGLEFSPETLAVASYVLGRKYESGRCLEHALYWGHYGTTMVVRTKHFDAGYSDAFAGSGESAALTLIDAVEKAKRGSLILLDEPETSLHPSAQQHMLEFLVHKALVKDLQFVIATHSQFFGERLPIEAVRLLREGPDGRIMVVEGLPVQEALHDVADLPHDRTILVEDERAKHIVLAALKDAGNLKQEFQVTVRRGGLSSILSDIKAYAASGQNNVLMVLDGDQRPAKQLPEESEWPRGCAGLDRLIGEQTRASNKNGPSLSFIDEDDRIKYLRFLKSKVRYLPGDTPESLVWVDANVIELGKMYGLDQDKILEIEKSKSDKLRIQQFARNVSGLSDESVFENLLAMLLRTDSPEAKKIKVDLVDWIRKQL